MIRALREDATERPDLFVWRGAIRREELREWLDAKRLDLPDDLVELWLETGGGDLFESETLLAPFGDPASGDDVGGVNEAFRIRGLSSAHLIVSTGIFLAALRLADKKWVLLDQETFQEERECGSFDDWYRLVRAEFAERYGLRGS